MGQFVARTGTMTRKMGRPYPGSRPFAEADFDHFFGRSEDAETLATIWHANRLTLAIGPTASGKTSLLLAGVLPLVRCYRGVLLPPGRISYGSGYPVAALPDHNPYTLSLLRSWMPGEPVTGLFGLTVRDFVRRQAERHEGPILAAIDQAEDVLGCSGVRAMHRRDFLDNLTEAVREEPRLHLLLMIRASAADEFSRALGGVPHAVSPLSFHAAVEAVTGPADRAGRVFAPEAAEELLTDLLTSYISVEGGEVRRAVANSAQPALLQVVCAQLWDSLPPDVSLVTSRDVRAYADADLALTGYCGRSIAAVADEHHLKAPWLRSWLISAFVADQGTCETVPEGVADKARMPKAVLRDLEDRHLLSSERRSGSRWYQLLSERLIEPLRHAPIDRPPPVDLASHLAAAERALTFSDLNLAERYAAEILGAASPGDFRLRAEVHTLLGNIAYERGKPDAEAQYREAARLFEAARDTGAAARELAAVGQVLLAQGRVSDAVDELEAAVRRLPNDLVVQAELAWAHWQLGRAGAAEAIFTDILSVDAGNARALRGRGEILADIGKGREAMRDLSRTAPHDNPSTRAARALALAELGEYEGAAKEIDAALEQAERNGPVLLYAARAKHLSGDKDTAAELAERATYATDPPLPPHQRDQALKLSAAGTGNA
jgi:tetratricopeptide (TPR) repeat protein